MKIKSILTTTLFVLITTTFGYFALSSLPSFSFASSELRETIELKAEKELQSSLITTERLILIGKANQLNNQIMEMQDLDLVLTKEIQDLQIKMQELTIVKAQE